MTIWISEAATLSAPFDRMAARLISTLPGIGALSGRRAAPFLGLTRHGARRRFQGAGALMALLALSACDDAGGMLAGLQLPALSKETPNTALAQSQMANSAFTLVPPQGFCIDKNTLRQRFALMARCDVLGAPSLAAGAPMGLITVSVTPQAAEAPLPTPEETAMAARLTNVEGVTSEVDALTFRADGKPPASGFGDTHWRGSVRLGDQVMGLALYGEDGGRAASAEGREILNDLIRSTREANKPNG